jgi:hypothetical protein
MTVASARGRYRRESVCVTVSLHSWAGVQAMIRPKGMREDFKSSFNHLNITSVAIEGRLM